MGISHSFAALAPALHARLEDLRDGREAVVAQVLERGHGPQRAHHGPRGELRLRRPWRIKAGQSIIVWEINRDLTEAARGSSR